MDDDELAAELSPDVRVQLDLVDDDRKTLLNRALKMGQAYSGAVYPFDLFANGALNRAVALSSGFYTMIQSRNLICAGAVVRLHLDTAARFAAGFLVAKPHDFAMEVLRGTQIGKMSDRNGNKMTDRYLISYLATEFPWVKDLYDQTCDYVHFSDAHLHSAFDGVDQERGVIKIKISSIDREFPDSVYSSAILAFRQVTGILLRYVDGWIFTKENPELIAKIKSAHEAEK